MDTQRKILIVDDSDLVANVLKSQLEQNNFKVDTASNGVEAIIKSYQFIPDLIIMDVEMPMLQGYQASRLLKSKRGVKDIPIIMHTSLTEDKDKFWSYSCGADVFVQKDFNNLDYLLEKVKEFSEHEELKIDIIKEDAENINQDKIMEMLSTLFDAQLFQAAILNQLGEVGRSIGSMLETIIKVMRLLNNLCEVHIAVIFIKYFDKAIPYIKPSDNIYKNDVQDFLNICLQEFQDVFPELSFDEKDHVILGLAGRDNFEKERVGSKEISSYICLKLKGKGGQYIGTLHLGNFTNNYFSDKIAQDISLFASGAGIVVENAILFNQVSEMEQKIRNVFSKFVPPEIIDDMVSKQTTSSCLVGEKRQVVVLFSDIRSFTTISENNRAVDIVNFLNNYFQVMVSIIKKYGGTIDKFIGDAILAIFGAPKSYKDNAKRAVMASMEMIKALPTINPGNLKLPPSGLKIGIGIHEGEVIVGNIGSQEKFDYTVIGDTVNLASRLEGLTKPYRSPVIISETVKAHVPTIPTREIDLVKVKGKVKPTSIYSVFLKKKEITKPEFIKNYNKAMSMYKIKNWKTALEYFQNVLKIMPNDYISQMYIERCNNFIKNPPPENWDGAKALDFK